MTIRELRNSLGDTQTDFSRRYHIPFRTIQNWEAGVNKPPAYVAELLENQVREDLITRRQYRIPEWENARRTLPDAEEYRSVQDWLLAVRDELDSDIVFALDSALMCDGSYLGRMGEWIIWIYGPTALSKYKGVCVIGDRISPCDIEESTGLRYTSFNRTLNDAMANERILDMQGITEALSRYYYTHDETFYGLHPDPVYIELFDELSDDAVHYYDD